MNFIDIFIKTIETPKVNTVIFSSLFIILMGYYFRKKNIFGENLAKVLTNIILSVSLPALAFKSFMVDINHEMFHKGIGILIWSILVYIILILLSKLMYIKYNDNDSLRVLTIFGATTTFGIPIVIAIYGEQGALYSSIFNIGYRIFLYSYAYVKMSDLKMTKDNFKSMLLNPIIVATFLGLFIWIFQEYLPQVDIYYINNMGKVVTKSFAIFRIDKTFSQFYQVLIYLSGLASPIAWLAIGATLGSVSFKQAISDKKTWYYTFIKLIIVPLINLICLIFLKILGMPIDLVGLGTIIIMMTTPPGTVPVAYAISNDKDPILASNTSLLSTLWAVIMVPIWIIIVEIVWNAGIFI